MSMPKIPPRAWMSALVIALVAVAANFFIWWVANQPVAVPSFSGKVEGFALSAFQR